MDLVHAIQDFGGSIIYTGLVAVSCVICTFIAVGANEYRRKRARERSRVWRDY